MSWSNSGFVETSHPEPLISPRIHALVHSSCTRTLSELGAPLWLDRFPPEVVPEAQPGSPIRPVLSPDGVGGPETLNDLLAVSRRLLARRSHGCPLSRMPPCSPRSPAIASASGHRCERHRARSAVLRSPRMAVRRAYGIFR